MPGLDVAIPSKVMMRVGVLCPLAYRCFTAEIASYRSRLLLFKAQSCGFIGFQSSGHLCWT